MSGCSLREGGVGVSKSDPRKLTPETQKRLAEEILAFKASHEPRPWVNLARNKQLPPDHPRHHLPWEHPKTGKIYSCGCDGVDNEWTRWVWLAGRGCIAGHTRIYLPLEDRHERVDVLASEGKSITILALTDDGSRPAATDGAPFIRGVADLYEVKTEDGQVITVTGKHRFLTLQGWQRLADVHVGQLLASGAPVPPSEPPSSYLPWNGGEQGDLHSMRKAEDSPDDYLIYPRSDDGQLPLEANSVPVFFPSRAGAVGYNLRPSPVDGRDTSGGYNHLRLQNSRLARSSSFPDELSREDEASLVLSGALGLFPHYTQGWHQSPGRTFPEHGEHGVYFRKDPVVSHLTFSDVLPLFSGAPGAQPPSFEDAVLSSGRTLRRLSQDSSVSHQLHNESVSRSAEFSTLAYLDTITWTVVKSITPAGTDVFYDMHVPGAENYAAEGFWQHNCGKTRSGAEWTLSVALSEPGIYVGVCAPTFMNVRATCFEDLQSGIIACAQPGEIVDYNRNDLKIKMRNGSVIRGFSAQNVDSVRGANLSYCWFDELGSIQYTKFYTYGLEPAMRIRPKNNPCRMVITTTPSKLRLIRDLVEEAETNPKIHITAAVSEENPFFDAEALLALRRRYKGTYLEKQELEGILVDGMDGALFSIENFSEHRVFPGDEPEFRRIVVAIDPATTSSDSSDESGIIVIGESLDHEFYTLQDCSMRGTPDQCMRTVAEAFHRWEADLVVGENTVGDYMPELLAKQDPNIPYKSVAAMKAKFIRAESVSVLAAQGRVHMVGVFDELEKQLSSMSSDVERARMHDDRADAWVWAMIELSRRGSANYKEVYGFFPCLICGEDVNQTLDKACKNGHPVLLKEKEKTRDRSTRWSGAYMKTCEKNHEFPMRLTRCPECNMDAAAYMGQILKYAGMNSGWVSYTGKRDLFSGRKI